MICKSGYAERAAETATKVLVWLKVCCVRGAHAIFSMHYKSGGVRGLGGGGLPRAAAAPCASPWQNQHSALMGGIKSKMQ